MKRWLVGLSLAFVLAGGAAGVAAWVVYERTQEPYRGFEGSERFVEIPTGQGSTAIGRRLVEAGVVRDDLTFRVAVWMSGRARELKAGEYRFESPMNAVAAVDQIARGDVYKHLLTFPEGLTIPEMARVFEERGFGLATDFVRAASNAALVRDLDPAAADLEGYLFPETYALPRRTPATELVEQMVATFTRALDEDLRRAGTAGGLTIRQVVTLASLVEKETAHPDERGLVAAVYRNRLARGMAMQADPTVIYALQKAARFDGNLRRDDLLFDSPYNTYKYPGLPPGPIAAPGLAALQAAARPADVRYVYFVSRNDGSHAFASTLAEHNRNVFTWQIQYFRQKPRR